MALQAVQFFAAIDHLAAMSVPFLGDFGDESFHLVGREFAWAACQPDRFRERFAQHGNLPEGGIERSERDLRRVGRQLFVGQRGGDFVRSPFALQQRVDERRGIGRSEFRFPRTTR